MDGGEEGEGDEGWMAGIRGRGMMDGWRGRGRGIVGWMAGERNHTTISSGVHFNQFVSSITITIPCIPSVIDIYFVVLV